MKAVKKEAPKKEARKGTGEELLDEIVQFRTTKEGRAALVRKAKEAGAKDLSEYARARTFQDLSPLLLKLERIIAKTETLETEAEIRERERKEAREELKQEILIAIEAEGIRAKGEIKQAAGIIEDLIRAQAASLEAVQKAGAKEIREELKAALKNKNGEPAGTDEEKPEDDGIDWTNVIFYGGIIIGAAGLLWILFRFF